MTHLTGIILVLNLLGVSMMSPCAPTGTFSLSQWQTMWNNVPNWVFGDAGHSIKHPTDGRYLFVFGDSIIKKIDGSPTFVHNSAVHYGSQGLSRVSGDTELIPNMGDSVGSYFWPGPLTMDNGKLYSFAQHLTVDPTQPPGFNFKHLGNVLSEFDWASCANPVFRGNWQLPNAGKPKEEKILWGAGTVKISGYHYIYGTKMDVGNPYGSKVYVARVATGKLTNISAWQYWNGTSWVTNNESVSTPIIAAVGGTESVFNVIYENSKVVITSKLDGPFGNKVGRWSSTQPQGSFSYVNLFDSPYYEYKTSYLALGHATLRTSDGKALVSVSHNATFKPNADGTDYLYVNGQKVPIEFSDLINNPQWFRNTWHTL